MRVLFLQKQPCIRSLKYAQGFNGEIRREEEVRLFFGHVNTTLTEFYGYGDEFFQGFFELDTKNLETSIQTVVKKCSPDLIHSHNAPDFLTVAAINATEGLPIIHDNHDVISLRRTEYYKGADVEKMLQDEKVANEQSDARIHVTEGVKDFIQRKYGVGSKKDLTYQSYVPGSMIPALKERLSQRDNQIHIAYEGTVDSNIEGSHYDLGGIFRDIASHEMHIHIYVSRENEFYEKLAKGNEFIHYHGHLNTTDLFQELTQYDFGWAGFNAAKNAEHLNVALPNKVMEYVACGLPVLSFPHETQKRFIENHGIGLVLNNLDGLTEQIENGKLDEIRETVLRKRHEFTVESNIDKVVDFYKDLIETC